MQYVLNVKIAGLNIETNIDSKFTSVINLFEKIRSYDKSLDQNRLCISIWHSDRNEIVLSPDYNNITIKGPKIDDIKDSFNLFGILQAIFRFTAIHLAKRGIILLHGSAAVLNGKVICFGDDGSSTAKTLGSLEIALKSGFYTADEFCFFNTDTLEIYGYSFVPIHVRPIVSEHILTRHNLSISSELRIDSETGVFFEPEKFFRIKNGLLNSIYYVHFSDIGFGSRSLDAERAIRSLQVCATTHIAKLLYPELDRMQFVSRTDTHIHREIPIYIIDLILERFFQTIDWQLIITRIHNYKLTIQDPCQVISLIKKTD